jgi:hypothetical protein
MVGGLARAPVTGPHWAHRSTVDPCHTRFPWGWASMIVWINGAYGSGKTTLVTEITRTRSDAAVFDPEHLGHLLRQSVLVPTDNFQDLPSWREIVVASGS